MQKNQAAVNGIRSSGATSQLITVEGTCESSFAYYPDIAIDMMHFNKPGLEHGLGLPLVTPTFSAQSRIPTTTSLFVGLILPSSLDAPNFYRSEMHQYLDSDGSGTSPNCVSATIGAERLAAATAWLKANNLKGFLGEIGAGSNTQCISAVKSALCSMQQSGVWIGALWWAAGPWWGTYFQSIEPPNGAAISQILPQALKPFM
ncbi:hypothetical protein H0H81_005630 [Sphagnurus paluster]|uniref:cellulase n=1 Tax=Sphagnurus paluster TaxID=117069 RepID=A0A9P7FU55_9AGAR|nr:hypothetical protein H0H81_005630 [Sphagnurus paluster]